MENCLFVDIVRHLPVGLVVWELENLDDPSSFKLVEVNPFARQILGLPPQQDLKSESDDPFPAFLKIEMPTVYAEVIRLGIVKDLGEIRYRDRHHDEKTFTLRAFPLNKQQMGVMFEDMSDRKRAEESLRQSEQRRVFHVQQTPLAFIEQDLNAQLIEWNPAAEKIFGYSKREALGQVMSDLIVPANIKPQIDRIWTALVTKRGGTRSTNSNVTKDGQTITCEWYNTPLVDEEGKVIGVASLVQDVTERQQTQAAIAASEMRYRRLFETAQDGILILNAETGQITDANPSLTVLLCSSRQELLGKTLKDIGLVQIADITQLILHPLQNETVSVSLHNGQTVDVELVSSVYEVNRQTVIQCSIRNITERKRLESELRQFAVRLEQSNRELQDFASVASHDLQEPLRKIQAFGDRLNIKYSAVLDEEGQDYVRRMQNAAHRMQTLISDLLTFSRITTQAQPFVNVNLNTIVAEVLSDLEIHIQQANAQVKVTELPTIEAEPLQMRQLMQNLISNALKFHGDAPPTIVISSRVVEKPVNRLKDAPQHRIHSSNDTSQPIFCEIAVADNGIGFDEKYLDRIFTVFQRLHGRDAYPGTGIGLAICRKIVERHGGSINAVSIPQRGATFFATLPVQQPH